MAPLIKLVVGVAGTSLLAMAAFSLARAPLLSDLGSRTADVMVAHGITDGRANWVTPAGWTFRVARLSGTADATTRIRTRDAVAALTGVHGALWEDEATTAAPATAVPAAVGQTGCQPRVNAIIAGRAIAFGTSDATIDRGSLRQVDAIAQALQRCPAMHVDVIGHTGPDGAAAVNLALSQARAEAVVSALAERGIAGNRLAAIGQGRSGVARIDFELHPPAADRERTP
jgi:OOP family OmpA-OmpF porin